MKFIIVLLSMIFCHIVDDYYLQGWLASAKQKSWWEKNAPEKMYRKDYIMALFMHGFSWSFMITLPIMLYMALSRCGLKEWILFSYVFNIPVHCVVDDMKANKKQINLIQDQLIHMVQIFATWIVFYICV